MRKLLLLLILSMFNLSVFAQEEEVATVEDSLLDLEFNKHEGYWEGLEFGLNMLTTGNFSRNFSTDPQWENTVYKSFYFNINFLDHKFILKENKLGITTGFGANFTQVAFQDRWTLSDVYSTNDSIVYGDVQLNPEIDYSTNKLKIAYVHIPVLLEFTPNKKTWISAGVIGGFKVASSTKQVIEDKNLKTITKNKGSFGIIPFKLDATIRVGHKDWGMFANYALVNLFNTKNMAQVRPINFGVLYNF
jgi:hypothetical protein